jgi:hypothetical protein
MPLFCAQSVSYLHNINLYRVLRIENRQGARMKPYKNVTYYKRFVMKCGSQVYVTGINEL